MFTGDDLVGIDLDGVYDLQGGRFTNPLAEAFVRNYDSYTEVSPSGKGVKLWIRSSIHPTRCTGTISRLNETVDFETYYKSRWFAVTGHVLPQYGDGQIQDRTVIYGKMMAEIASQKAPRQANTAAAVVPASGSVDDEAAMLRAALKRINADAEGTWFRMACCLKWWGAQDGVGDARARALWDEWSRSSEDKFDPTSQEERWQRIVPDGGLTIGTIFAAAMEEGYVRGDALASDGREYRIERVRPIAVDLAAPASGKNLPSEEKP
ncbi:MAG: PriCT-2 domain-containing protein, partial [Terrimicrobiaceae bacterium]